MLVAAPVLVVLVVLISLGQDQATAKQRHDTNQSDFLHEPLLSIHRQKRPQKLRPWRESTQKVDSGVSANHWDALIERLRRIGQASLRKGARDNGAPRLPNGASA